MSMENLTEEGFERLRAMDVSGCHVHNAHLAAKGRNEWRLAPAVGRTETAATAAMHRAGLGQLLGGGHVFLAGGALLRAMDGEDLESSGCDLDVHARSRRDVELLAQALREAGYDWDHTEDGKPHVWTWTRNVFPRKVQVVTYADEFPTRASCVARHDLHVCQWVLDGSALWCTQEAFDDWSNRELRVNQAVFPRDLVRRLSKYAARDYRVTPQALDALYEAMGRKD